MPRWLVWIVVGIVALVIVGGIVEFAVLPYLKQPKMTLTDLQYSDDRGSCDSFFSPVPPQFFSFSFVIRNTGDADGFATVSFIVFEDATGRQFPNPMPFAQNRYFVPSQAASGKDATVQVNDCYASHTWSVIISAVEKA